MGALLVWQDGAVSKSLALDLVVKENHEDMAEATEHNVERGADVTDHVRNANPKLTLEIFVTNSPLGNTDARPGLVITTPLAPASPDRTPKLPTVLATKKWINPVPLVGLEITEPVAFTPAQDGPPILPMAVQTVQFASEFDDVREVHEKLLEIKEAVHFLQVITPKKHYTDMVITHVTMPRDASSGDGASITIEFKKLRIVSTSIVNAPKPTEPRGNGMTHRGHQGLKEAKAPDRKRSAAIELGIGKALGVGAKK